MARPSDYTDELACDICGKISEGQSLRKICAAKGMPDRTTVFRWLDKDMAFRDQYARAREAQTEFWAHEIIEIADTPLEGQRTEEGTNADGEPFSKTVREDMLGHRRLQIDARKWLMSKLAPKKYGDKLELGGSVGITAEDRLSFLK